MREPLKTSVFRGNFENAMFKSPQFRAFKLDGNLNIIVFRGCLIIASSISIRIRTGDSITCWGPFFCPMCLGKILWPYFRKNSTNFEIRPIEFLKVGCSSLGGAYVCKGYYIERINL